MKGILFLDDQPVAQLDETRTTVFKTYDVDPIRVSYSTKKLNTGKTLTEMQRTRTLVLKMEDGRQADVVLQHSSLDMEGNLVGVLRVVGDFKQEDDASDIGEAA